MKHRKCVRWNDQPTYSYLKGRERADARKHLTYKLTDRLSRRNVHQKWQRPMNDRVKVRGNKLHHWNQKKNNWKRSHHRYHPPSYSAHWNSNVLFICKFTTATFLQHKPWEFTGQQHNPTVNVRHSNHQKGTEWSETSRTGPRSTDGIVTTTTTTANKWITVWTLTQRRSKKQQ